MKLPANRIHIDIYNIDSVDSIKFLKTDNTITLIKLNNNLTNNLLSQREKIVEDVIGNAKFSEDDIQELYTSLKIEYKDIHDIVISSVSKVFFNDVKMGATVKALTNINNKDLIESWNLVTNDNIPSGYIQLFKYKFHVTQSRYQDKRRVERMIKEYKFRLIDELNEQIKCMIYLIYSKCNNINAPLLKSNEIDMIYLETLYQSINNIEDVLVPVAIPGKATVFIKERTLFKSKYIRHLNEEGIFRILSIINNIKHGYRADYTQEIKANKSVRVRIV